MHDKSVARLEFSFVVAATRCLFHIEYFSRGEKKRSDSARYWLMIECRRIFLFYFLTRIKLLNAYNNNVMYLRNGGKRKGGKEIGGNVFIRKVRRLTTF